ncbi:murein biosynthesis integral membrane protein MurJ [Candidatus Sororendozoicomonas aggregata]|uniref:murein biosynthesis integral membrane protein MurJ n=1 Tax=Candidatus Sororendozoicomonas aggregata TaxID=3073239 RepID=UPI002ED4AE6A
MFKTLLLSSLVLNTGLLLGRLSGFVREGVVASTYGVGSDADVVILMLTIPDFLVNILMGGALGVTLIPEFIKAPETARRLLYQALFFFGVIFFIITLCLNLNMGVLVSTLAPGLSDIQHCKTTESIRWVIWMVPLSVVTGVITAFLQAKYQYAVPAMGTLIVNSSIIVGLVIAHFINGNLFVLSTFILLGGVLRLVSQLARIGSINLYPIKITQPFIISKALFFRYVQAVASGCTLLLFPVVGRSQASYMEEGSVAVLNYVSKLIEFPLALTVTFLSVILLPKLSQSYFENKIVHMKVVKYGMQITLVLSVLSASALSAISEVYSSSVFGYGKITTEDISSIADLVSLGMVLLPLMGMATYLTAVFNSRKNTLAPFIVNFSGLIGFVLIYESKVYGADLSAIILSMAWGYAMISIIFMVLLFASCFSQLSEFFDVKILISTLISSFFIYEGGSWLQGYGITNWLVISIVALQSILFLSVIACLDNEIREKIKLKIRTI